MKRSDPEHPADLLFDLPLDPSAPEPPPAETGASEPPGGDAAQDYEEPEAMPLWDPEEAADSAHHAEELATEPEPSPRWVAAPLQPRIFAAALDVAAIAAVLGIALLLLLWLEVTPTTSMAPALGLFLASFSFVYFVVPLAFWGRTPGMARAQLVARSKRQDPLTIQQALFRWLGFLLVAGSAGVLGLLTLAGISPADLISRSRVFLRKA